MKHVTRREFLGTSAGVGAAALGATALGATSALPKQVLAWAGGTDSIKVGLIGCGGRGTGAATQALAADTGTILYAMADAFPGRIESSLAGIENDQKEREAAGTANATLGEKIQVPAHRRFTGLDAYKQVIAECDMVILTTPPGFRPAHLAAAVEAGCHVFCEKPVAVDGTGVRSVLESVKVARAKNLTLMSGFCWRHQNQVVQCFEKLLSGGIGEIASIQANYNTTGWIQPKPRQPEWTDAEFMVRNWHYFTPLSGDHIVEQAVHAIDWIGWVHRDVPPVRCTASGGRMTRPSVPETGNVWDNFSVIYEYADGSRGYHMCRHWPESASDNTAYITGTRGRCTMDPWRQRHVIEGEAPWVGSAPANDMYQSEHDTLFARLRGGDIYNDGEHMAHSTLMAIMGRMAAYTGQVVTWEQAMNSKEDLLAPQPWELGPRTIPTLPVPGKTRLV